MNKIACIVVTYNRLELLKRCIESLKNQTKTDFDIFVINNGSKDGTKEWIDYNKELIAIHQDNVGGAGGFYRGMKEAYEKGYEWIWLMDDDGKADSKQLEELYKHSKNNNLLFSNALVCNIENPAQLSFGLNVGESHIVSSTQEAQKNLLINTINPFNGTFINRKVIDKIGFIKKEMFIWGDETEFTYRARKNGFVTMTITTAVQYHPLIKGINCNVIPFWNKYNVNVKPKNLSHIYYRNMGYIYKNYLYKKYWSPIILYSVLFLRKFQFIELIKFIKYYKKGSKGIFL